MSIITRITSALESAGLSNVLILSQRGLGGGCINDAVRLETSAGVFLVKSNSDAPDDMFEQEFAGLEALHAVGAIRIPRPIAYRPAEADSPAFLITEFLEKGPQPDSFFADFGRQFAELHRRSTADRFGFHAENYIGSTPQPNAWTEDWTAFFREHRLGFQLRLAEKNGYGGELQRLGARLLDRLPEFIDEPNEPPALLHGDLWSGNFLCTADGQPALIDPAVYYGRREADLAMTKLFGGFPRHFHDAYNGAWPLAEGTEVRQDIYMLYHLLNHLNLFGGGYHMQCVGLLKRYA